MDRVIRGIVRSAGAPVPFARVMVEMGPGPMPDIAILSGADGRFAVDTPFRGPYALMISADEYRPAHLTADVSNPEDSVEVAVELRPDSL